MSQRNPFSAGRWVCGDQFYGREELLKLVIDSIETCDWIIGKRRVGKTSFLRQLEHLINARENNEFAIFWDIQGSYDEDGLGDSFIDALEDSRDQYPDHWQGIEFDPMDHDSEPIAGSLKKFIRTCSRKGKKVHLLIDEAEEFINIGKQNPATTEKLRKVFQTSRNLHTVISSTPRLEYFHKEIETRTSPFLHGFHARYLGNFDRDAAMTLLSLGIEQASDRENIYLKTDGNPFELQLFAKHFFENPNLEEVTLQLEANPSLIQVIEVNFDIISEEEQDLLKDVFCGKNRLAAFDSATEKSGISKLLQLGYLHKDSADTLRVCSYFNIQWMSSKFDEAPSFHAPHQSDPVLTKEHTVLLRGQILTVYKFFLELSQEHLCIQSAEGCFKVSTIDKTIYPDRAHTKLTQDTTTEGEGWMRALKNTVAFLKNYLSEQESWPVFRLYQMADEQIANYSENEYLDIMMLIAEEAELEK